MGNKEKKVSMLEGEMWGIIPYFNPVGYSNKLRHLHLCSSAVRSQGLKLVIVEARCDDLPFEVSNSLAEIVLHLRSPALAWMKERLLNYALRELPHQCDRLVWLDSDVLFMDDDWIEETKMLLQESPIVQPFKNAIWLTEKQTKRVMDGQQVASNMNNDGIHLGAAAAQIKEPHSSKLVGHEGFGWAVRRSLISRTGFYEHCIVGGADTIMASAIYNFDISVLLDEYFCKAQVRHATLWMREFHSQVRGKASHASGKVLHLWHGPTEKRQYLERLLILKEALFDPDKDIAVDIRGGWRWISEKPELHKKIEEYLFSRAEGE